MASSKSSSMLRSQCAALFGPRLLLPRTAVSFRGSLYLPLSCRSFNSSHRSRERNSGPALPKPRLDYRSIIQNSTYKSHNTFNRRANLPVNTIPDIVKLHASQTELNARIGHLKAERSKLGDDVQKGGDSKAAAVEGAKILKEEIRELEAKLSKVDEELLARALLLPNDTHLDVPLGPEPAAKVLATHGPNPLPVTPARHHVSINQSIPFMDLEGGVMSSGSSWYFLKDIGAFLELALINYSMSVAIKHGFVPIMTPDVVKEDVATRCGFQPRDEAGAAPSQNYYLNRTKDEPQLVLAGTAEIPLGAMFAGKIFEKKSLPQKVVGLGRAFRAEAGARGADTRGLYRVHQFSKVEMFVVCDGDVHKSNEMMEEMKKIQTEIFENLGLTFRILDMPTEELGASAYRKYDMEAWMPGRGGWGEISSLSNCTDYQARRLHIRHALSPASPTTSLPEGRSTPSTAFAHTLNGTAAAIPRLIVALVENGVQLDGKKIVGLTLPKTLRPFWLGSGEGIHWA
ncbi:Serine--tRNA ligase, mitochondrial [Tulasnella sp. JGI-2019a]|nr:Serine--tRNA ligase, mitochondrial [Tulasnella sp. JGI-2019a]